MDCKRLWPVAGMVKPTLLVRTGRRSGLCYQFTRIILHYILCFVRFQFEENVSTFAAGLYSLSPGMTTPALVYVTFNNKIQVSSCVYCHYQYNCNCPQLYHNIGLERGISLSSLVHWPGMVEEAKEMLDILGVDTTDMRQLQEVYRYCLYGVR